MNCVSRCERPSLLDSTRSWCLPLSVASHATRAHIRSSRSTPGRAWPKAFRALEVRNYRLYLSSQIVATTGLWMQRIAQDWLVLQLTGKVSAVGFAVALQFAPVLIFGLVGGVIADRFPKRRILMITQGTAALMAASLGALALTHTVQVWQVYVIATVLGFVTVVDNPTRQVFVSELVGRDHIRNAVSLNSSVFQFGALLGPALSGLLINAVGQGWSFLINCAACLTVVVMVFVIRPTADRSEADAPAAGADPCAVTPQRWTDGLRYILRTPEIRWTILLVGAIGLFGSNMPVTLAAFANNEFKLGVSGYSLFTSLVAIGALLGALLSARRTERQRLRGLVRGLLGLGAALALASIAPTTWSFGAVLVGAGLCTLLFLTGANSLVQMTAAPELRGRVMSVYLLVLLGSQALGGPVVGRLIDQVGARVSMAGCGLTLLTLTLLAAALMGRQSHLRVSWSQGRGLTPHIVRRTVRQ